MKRSALITVFVMATALIAAACDEEQLTGPGFVCDVTNPVRDVLLFPTNGQLLVRSPARSSDTLQLAAVATNRNGVARTDVPIEFSSSDQSVATVDASGVVRGLKPGVVRITASTCGESATTQITVLAAVATVSVSPALDTLLTADSTTIVARATGQTGQRLADVVFSFAAAPSGLVTLTQTSDSTVKVVSVNPGTVTITATGEGAIASAVVLVLARGFLAGTAVAGSMDSGGDLSCGIITLGQAFCWGLNDRGQLGAVTDSVCFNSTISTVVGEDSVTTTALSCSLLPLSVSRTTQFASIAVGDVSACAINTTGRALCWGDNKDGQLGNGSTASSAVATLVTSALTFTAITVGGNHACGLAAGGVAYCWGADSFGQLGDSRNINSTTPIPVVGGPAAFASISAGASHTCAVASGGTGSCWGNNDRSQIGDGLPGGIRDTPAGVGGGLSFASIGAGGNHSCGLTTVGAAFCWGANDFAQLGNGAVGGASAVPVAVAGGLTFSRIAVGASHTCAMTAAGEVYCWGLDADLQLGRGPFSGGGSVGPTAVRVLGGELPSGVNFTNISAGTRHSCAAATNGAAYCWGSNVYGALGNTFQAAFRGFPQRVATPQ